MATTTTRPHLRDSHSQHPTVAAAEIGAIGYYSRADMVDYFGLLDSRANNSVRRGDFSWWLTQKPDYWVTSTDVATGESLDARTLALPEFQREYRLRRRSADEGLPAH